MTPLPEMDKLQKMMITTGDRQMLLKEIEQAQAQLFSPNGKPLQEEFGELAALLSGASDIGKALGELRSRVLDMPVVRLTLAFEPTREQLEKLAEPIRSGREGISCVIEIEVDPKIMAGVVISDAGIVTDKTLKKKVEGVLLKPILAKYSSFFA